MFQCFVGATADEAWRSAAACFGNSNDVIAQPSRDGQTRELLHACFVVQDPRQRLILSRRPAINPAFAIAEVVWMLRGRDDAAFLNHWNPALPKFAGDAASYHGAYGHRLRHGFGVDQLERAYQVLARDPDSRQVVLQTWDASRDLPSEDGRPRAADIPCNIMSMLKVRRGRLEWMQVLRSNDLFLGLPHNVVQFTSLQEVLAGWLGVELGPYHQLSDSLHVYDRDWKHVHMAPAMPAIPTNTDSLMLGKGESEMIWGELASRMGEMVERRTMTALGWRRNLAWTGAPEAFQNLLRIVAADDARRRGWMGAVARALRECTNPVLRLAWNRWVLRCAQREERLALASGHSLRGDLRR
jgi:thymidylate synthase